MAESEISKQAIRTIKAADKLVGNVQKDMRELIEELRKLKESSEKEK